MSQPKTQKTYGFWKSPLSPQSLATDRRLEAARFDSDGQTVVWLEGRSGRGVLVAQSLEGGEAPRDLTSELSVRAEVGYGGGDFAVHQGHVYFIVHKTGRIFRQRIACGQAEPITPAAGNASSPAISPDGRHVAYVHQDEEDIDRIAVADVQGSHWPQILSSGHDFYMQPRWSPDGRRFAYIAWDHPNMPWDGTTLFVADVVERPGELLPRLGEPQAVAGGRDVAVFQPEFAAEGDKLFYVSDADGWARLAMHDLATGEVKWLTPEGSECSLPAWVQDRRTYAVAADGTVVFAALNSNAHSRLVAIDLQSLQSSDMSPENYTAIDQVVASPKSPRVAFVGSSTTTPPRIVVCDQQTRQPRVVARSSGETVAESALSTAEHISWPTAGGETAHGLFFSPASERYESSGKPPLIVTVHGGPTGQALAAWKSDTQFLTTRGYAVLAVNYRGSTGYGREYMLRLRGNWGTCDVEDSISGMRHLAQEGRVDPHRTVIMGGSAGGFTVLQTMTQHPEVFTAGVCLYGVADQFHLASMTHKFESRYLDTILGPLPEAAEVYRQRSPVNFADRITRPLAIFQGEVDRVVPQEQSDMIARALQKSGTPHIYEVYEGEGHGWRKAETIEQYYSSLEAFLREHVIFA